MRTTIVLPPEMRSRLRRVAADRGVSMSELIRQGIDEVLQKHRPKPRSIGMGASGFTDTARRAGEEPIEPRSWR